MEFAIYRLYEQGGRRMGKFVDMLATREEAEAFADKLEGEHEIVELWTREITEEDGDLWETVEFREGGVVEPVR